MNPLLPEDEIYFLATWNGKQTLAQMREEEYRSDLNEASYASAAGITTPERKFRVENPWDIPRGVEVHGPYRFFTDKEALAHANVLLNKWANSVVIKRPYRPWLISSEEATE